MKWLSDWLARVFRVSPDPVHNCPIYRDCAHVDGPLCSVPTCSDRLEAIAKDTQAATRAKGPQMNAPQQVLSDEEALNKLIRLAGRRDVIHSQFQGRPMSNETYDAYADLRDVQIPELKRAILAKLQASSQAAQGVVEVACPRCDGSGTVIEMSDSSPDAHEVTVECDHCGGAGDLESAYLGATKLLSNAKSAYYKALPYMVKYQNEANGLPPPAVARPAPSPAPPAAVEPTKVLMEHSGCGQGAQVDSMVVRLHPGDKVVLHMGPYTSALAGLGGEVKP